MYMNFYVYQYATGISAAHAPSHARRGPARRGRAYLDFLSGGSRYPLDALEQAGVDLRRLSRWRPRSACWPGWWTGWRGWSTVRGLKVAVNEWPSPRVT